VFELVLPAAMIVVFHVLSSAVYPADLRDAFFVPYFPSFAGRTKGVR
jgi:hypothetical protein